MSNLSEFYRDYLDAAAPLHFEDQAAIFNAGYTPAEIEGVGLEQHRGFRFRSIAGRVVVRLAPLRRGTPTAAAIEKIEALEGIFALKAHIRPAGKLARLRDEWMDCTVYPNVELGLSITALKCAIDAILDEVEA